MDGSPTVRISKAGIDVAKITADKAGNKNDLKSLLPMLRDIQSRANEQLTQLACKESITNQSGDGVQTVDDDDDDDGDGDEDGDEDDDDEHGNDVDKRKVSESANLDRKNEPKEKKQKK